MNGLRTVIRVNLFFNIRKNKVQKILTVRRSRIISGSCNCTFGHFNVPEPNREFVNSVHEHSTFAFR